MSNSQMVFDGFKVVDGVTYMVCLIPVSGEMANMIPKNQVLQDSACPATPPVVDIPEKARKPRKPRTPKATLAVSPPIGQVNNTPAAPAAAPVTPASVEKPMSANALKVVEQLRAKGCKTCMPYESVFTYRQWVKRGYQVKKGEHGIKVTTFKEITVTENGEEKKIRKPWTAVVFCKCQVEKMA
jgi:hypothetical protein